MNAFEEVLCEHLKEDTEHILSTEQYLSSLSKALDRIGSLHPESGSRLTALTREFSKNIKKYGVKAECEVTNMAMVLAPYFAERLTDENSEALIGNDLLAYAWASRLKNEGIDCSELSDKIIEYMGVELAINRHSYKLI